MELPVRKGLFLLLLISWLPLSCAGPFTKDKFTPLPDDIRRVAIMDLWPALSPKEPPRAVRSPFTGAVFMGEPVSSNVAREMTHLLYKGLVDKGGQGNYIFIPPGQTRGVKAAILSKPINKGQGMIAEFSIDFIRKVGQALGAQAVLGGIVYRWRERIGGPYGAERGASVGYELFLISVDTGRLLWKWRFDKTQLPLSGNLFDVETFIGGGGKWMTALELASLGLKKFYKEFPLR